MWVNILGTSTLTGCSTLKTYPINVKPVPQLTITPSATVVCEGTAVTMTVKSSSSTGFAWQGGQQGPAASYTPASQASYSVFGTAANGCTNTASVSVNVFNSPTISVTGLSNNICIGESTTFTATGAIGYTWSAPGFFSNNNPALFTGSAANAGTNIITVTGISSDGCLASESHSLTVFVCTALQNLKNKYHVKMFPSPASDYIVLDNLPTRQGSCILLISDNAGQIILREELDHGYNKILLDRLGSGNYSVGVYSKKELIYSQKLLVNR